MKLIFKFGKIDETHMKNGTKFVKISLFIKVYFCYSDLSLKYFRYNLVEYARIVSVIG